MTHFILVLLTINIHTGALTRSEAIGAPYETSAKCLEAAIAKGPQAANGDTVKILTCKGDGDSKTSI